MKSRLLFKYCLHLPVWLLLGFTPILQAQSSCIQLRFSTETANSGDTVTIRLTTLGFDNISSYQLAARWNPADLQYLQHSTANSPLPYQLFNPSQTVQGKLLCVWSDINAIGVSLPDESLIFELKFRVLATAPGNYPVWIDPDASPKYEMVQGVKVVPFVHTFGGIQLDTPGGFGIASICVTPPPCNAPVGSIELVLNGGAAPFQYQWEGPNGYTSTESNPDSLLPGNYNVTITDGAGAVARAATDLPFSYAAIAIGVINTQNAVCSQPNGCADLQISGGTGPYTFEWSAPGPATEDRCDLTPGYHYVTVTDVFGCKQSKYVEIENDSLLAVHLDSINADCRFGQPGSAGECKRYGTVYVSLVQRRYRRLALRYCPRSLFRYGVRCGRLRRQSVCGDQRLRHLRLACGVGMYMPHRDIFGRPATDRL
ncbi:MAG: hypothetical protein IPJ82_13795 [Lewinellaceae bacterium]|nr:hypothetical protein [Lewinellaceae bacterium]